MTKKVITDKQTEIDLLARTAWAEARGDGSDGMYAVINVIMNRVKKGGWWGATIEEVVKKPYQFSCWLPGDPNYSKMLAVTTADKNFATAYLLAETAVNEGLPDITGGSTHYHAAGITPSWADSSKRVALIGKHIFYKGIA